MKKLNILILLLFLIISKITISQSYEDFFSVSRKIEDSTRFHLLIDNTNFIKNNEYFNDFSEGYTLIGYFLKPRILFKAHKKVNIYAGIHLEKYFGAKKFTGFEPVFTVEYIHNKNFRLVFGELYGTVNHELTDFVFDNENYLVRNSENGIQIIFNNNRIVSDTWLEWRQYIFKDSPYPEILFFGTSNKFNILNINDKHLLNIKLAAVASHVGGQINSSDDPVETIMNTISGLEYNFITGNKYLSNIKLSGLLLSAIDASPNKRLEYEQGYGILSGIELSNKILSLKFQYWFGDQYFSKFGNPMFQSISQINNLHFEPKRSFINTHLFWSNEILDFFKLGVGVDLYYDTYNSHFDYSFGFYIKTNLDFKLKRRK